MLRPVLLVALLVRTMDAFTIFDQIFVLTRGGPGVSTQMMSLYAYNNAFKFFRMGYAATLAWLLFFIILAFTLVVLRWSAAYVYYEGKMRG